MTTSSTLQLADRDRRSPVDDQGLSVAVADLGAAADRRTAELQAGRRIQADLCRAAAEAGLFRQLVVSELGGLARTPLESMWREAVADTELSNEQRLRLHRANVTASRLSVRIVDLACELTGTAAVARGHVLSRCHRDAQALRGHISTNGASVEHNAKVGLGLSGQHYLV